MYIILYGIIFHEYHYIRISVLTDSKVYLLFFPQVISPVPQIEQFKLNSGWDFVVVATDGVWDAMTNNEILKYISNRLENKNRSIGSLLYEERIFAINTLSKTTLFLYTF